MKYISEINIHKNDISAEELKRYLSDRESPYKDQILRYMHFDRFESACTTAKVYDYILDKETDIAMTSYHDELYYWDDRDIYYFEKYNIKLSDEFVSHVLRVTKE